MRFCFRPLALTLGAFLVLLAEGGDLFAQADGGLDCEYAACALRVKNGFWGRSLVRGAEEAKISGLGFWVGDLGGAFAGSPVSQDLVASFRRRHNVGSFLGFSGLAVVIVGGIRNHGAFDDGVVTMGGVAAMLVGAILIVSAEDRLSEAVWEYNRLVNR